MSRERSKRSVTFVTPRDEVDVISVTPLIAEKARSSGVATELAIVSALAPGSEARTSMVGNSTCGSGATGSIENATRPAISMPTATNQVPIGRWTKARENLTAPSLRPWPRHQARLPVQHDDL